MYKNSVFAIIAQISQTFKLRCKLRLKVRFELPIKGLQTLYHSAMKLISKWLLLAAALLFVAYVYDGVTLNGFQAALIAAFVIGLLNTFVKPLLVILTLPVTIITVGLFLFVINALMFWGAASMLDGFNVTGFKAALIGSLIYSVLSYLINTALDSVFSKK